MTSAARVVEVLGGPDLLHKTAHSWRELEQIVRAGLPKRSLQLVAQRVCEPGPAPNELVYSIVPAATFKRRKRLSSEESQRTERLARVIAHAESVWGDPDEARSFLNRPHPLLDRRTPLDAARTELGARQVEQLLDEIEHGL